MSSDIATPDPSVVLDLLEAFRRSKTMFAAVSLGIFDTLESGPRSLGRSGHATLNLNPTRSNGCSTPAWDCNCSSGPARSTRTRRPPRLPLQAEPVSGDRLHQLLERRFCGSYGRNLEDAIREGTNRWQQTFGWDGPIFSSFFTTEESMREFLMAMHGYGLISSPHVVAAFDLSRFRRLVDLGGATGHLAIAACQRYPGLRGRRLRPARSRSSRPRDYRPLAGGQSDRNRLRRLLRRRPARGRSLRRGPHSPRLDGTQGTHRCWRESYDRLPSGGALLIAEKLISTKTGPARDGLTCKTWGCCSIPKGKSGPSRSTKRLLEQVGFSAVRGSTTASPLDAVLASAVKRRELL